MRITCDSCGRALDLPDEKVPDRRFSLACPSCQHKIVVDPPSASEVTPPYAAVPQAVPPAAQQVAQQAAPQAAYHSSEPSSAEDSDEETAELRPLRGADRELMESLAPTAVLIHLDVAPDPRLDGELKKLGFEDIQHCDSVQAGCDSVQENEVALVLVRMAKVPAPPCEPLEPLYRLPFDLRRSTFIALLADNVKTLDGQVAFYLEVNCLINSADTPKLARKLRRALLHHLRLYRHWHRED